MSSSYEVGTRCWFPDKTLGFVPCEVASNEQLPNGKYKLTFKLDGEEPITKELLLSSLDDSNPDLPHLRNPPILEAAEDLTSLSYLNEPAVLQAIKVRYSQLNIYTYSGIVLIATNPFQRIDQLYSNDIIQAYAGKNRGELEPHLFAIAEDAFRCMKRDHKNQTVVVSGESGAGKTVSAKFIMRYFASVEQLANGNDNGDALSTTDVERQILATNPIMESFGNAKTTRNDNSSRFGKYLEILFDSHTRIIGARIRTYLLERSRLVFQPSLERNYHIFYQMMEGLNSEQREELSLTSVEDFHYLNQGGDSKINNVDDGKDFEETSNALSLIGIDSVKQFEIWKILAALLHIGNIEVTATRSDASLSSEEPNLLLACKLLGISSPADFAKWIVKKQIVTRSEKITTNLTAAQANVAKDSVAKFIYSYLFDWLVHFVNSDLCPQEILSKSTNFIGVLDIYGFEHFKVNSFEQFCINYANEKLQQEFNQHVFKLEQEEYIREKIEWSFIEFSDNRPCINLIEGKLGILALLDEESRMPAGSDEGWIQKMYTQLDKPPSNKVFKKPRFGGNKFVVAHYAIDVEYDSEGFIEKNRDTVSDGHLETLKNSENQQLREIIETVEKQIEEVQKQKEAEAAAAAASNPSKSKFGGSGGRFGGAGKANSRKPTLGSIFKKSLIDLMTTINSTNVHYIRCIKPNEVKKAWEFDNLMVLSQLRACGVLETIRISTAGFPTRWTYEEFAQRYHILVPSSDFVHVLNGSHATGEDVRLLCNKILQATVQDTKKYQMGETKIFFKAGMLGHLEKLRSQRLNAAAVLIQKNIRAKIYRSRYLKLRESLISLQSVAKGYLRRRRIQQEIEEHSATVLQTLFRGYLVRRRYNSAINTIIAIQTAFKGKKARHAMFGRRQLQAAVTIQNAWRSYIGRKDFRTYVKAAIFVQSCLRRKMAIRQFNSLKTEAKSVNHLQEVSYRLENKVIELTQSLTSKISDNKRLTLEIESLHKKLNDNSSTKQALKSKEAEFKDTLNATKQEYIAQVDELNHELAQTKLDYKESESKLQQLAKEQLELKESVRSNIEELNNAKEQLAKYDHNEQELKKTITQLKQEIIALTGQGIHELRHVNGTNGMGQPGFGEDMVNADDFAATLMRSGEVIGDEDLNAINEELWSLLQNSAALNKEIVDSLLKGLKIPPASAAADLSKKEVLFPARIIIIILSDMWRLGLTKESEDFLGEVLSVIQSIVTNLKDDDVIEHGAFWLSNTHELYSFVSFAQSTIIANDTISNELSSAEYDEYLNLVAVVKEDFESLSYNIYNLWMKKMEKDLEKKATNAVILSQSLPGFMAPENSPFLSKVFSQGSQYKMDDILSFFNTVFWSMKTYFIEQEVVNEVITELLRFVDATCFNDLIMRRNFLSWKRGLQLNYNVTRLEEWCKSHDIVEGSSFLVHLLQAAKLLQLRKNNSEDIEIIYEICYALRPSQVQKLISQYSVADYETPIAPEVLQAVANKVKTTGNGMADDFLEPVNNGSDQFEDPFRRVPLRPFVRLEAYVPAWLQLPIVRRIIELVAKNASYQESAMVMQDQVGGEEEDESYYEQMNEAGH